MQCKNKCIFCCYFTYGVSAGDRTAGVSNVGAVTMAARREFQERILSGKNLCAESNIGRSMGGYCITSVAVSGC